VRLPGAWVCIKQGQEDELRIGQTGGTKRLILVMAGVSPFKMVAHPLSLVRWDHIWCGALDFPAVCHWRKTGSCPDLLGHN
jgi:hypothetical protein